MLDKKAWESVGMYYLFLFVCGVILSIAVGYATHLWFIIMLSIVALVGIPLTIRQIKRHRKELAGKELISVGDMEVK